MTHKIFCIFISGILMFCCITGKGQTIQKKNIDLAGEWSFAIDSLDIGIKENWVDKKFPETIHLPGSMNTNGKGDEVKLNTHWTGDARRGMPWWTDCSYVKYRQAGNIKVPFWLQPNRVYVGPAWYQKDVVIPDTWLGQHVELFLERCHWETTLWIDGKQVGMRNALGAPHIYVLDGLLMPGKHRLSLRIDNRIKDIDVGENAHSVSDHTQTNWNGIIGSMMLTARPSVYLKSVQLYPDIDKKVVVAKIKINNSNRDEIPFQLELKTLGSNGKVRVRLPSLTRVFTPEEDSTELNVTYPMGEHPLLWDEFSPNLYKMIVTLNGRKGITDTRQITFGMRKFKTQGTQFVMNNRLIFLRGTLECAIFPKTGFPPTDKAAWERIFRICRSYGLNHLRFHSWCPPEAAFDAADEAGFYLAIECSAWAAIGEGKPIDKFIFDESNRIVDAFGNHPSFCMMAYGNEPGGNSNEYLAGFVNYWKQKDSRRLYTGGAGWPVIAESDYNCPYGARIATAGNDYTNVLNNGIARTDYDWTPTISKWPQPTVSHEIGQWCVYPDFKGVKKYDGVLKPTAFDIFYDRLKEHHLENLADSFLYASGKLQVLCYKADIEAALRTKAMGGFQLLDLHDFPGQGTAIVGVLDPFWDNKGYVSDKEYSRFCNSTVPLFRTAKLVYESNELLKGDVEIAHFGSTPLKNITPTWQLQDITGKTLYSGKLQTTDIPIGNGIKLGQISQSLSEFTHPEKLALQIEVNGHINSWDIFVYPSDNPSLNSKVYVTQQLDEQALTTLKNGGKVLITTKKGSVKESIGGNVKVGFSPIFWNTYFSGNQPPHTLGILCNPKHPALAEFPTDYYSDWQWQDGMLHCNAIRLDSLSNHTKPIVRIIDDWYTARPLGLIFECKAGNGSLLISGIDLLTNQGSRPEAKQLIYSLEKYMNTPAFNPTTSINIDLLSNLFK